MSLFSKLTTDGIEEQTDRLGGGFSALDHNIYSGKLKALYAITAASGAMGVVILFEHAGGEYRETVYVTNKKGENFYVKDGKKQPLPGFTTVNNICVIATGKPLSEQDIEDKVFNIYDKEAQKELPKSVPTLVETMGQEISFGILKYLEDKTKLEGNAYVPTGETRDTNQINAVFHTETHSTLLEAEKSQDPEFWDKWLEKYVGAPAIDKTTKGGSAAGGKPAGGAPQAAAGQAAARPSLFNKK
ncbi:hypothetical protein Fifi067_00034 [Erwinia phage Fifi067]|nr:hypothetical protein Fifi067_00034 [Erwinia phage Fifi067]WBQ32521.1 putative ssDNA-binding protein [Erwinia phage Kuerle]